MGSPGTEYISVTSWLDLIRDPCESTGFAGGLLFNELVKMKTETPLINIEVACATERKQRIISLRVPEGTTVIQAVALSAIADEFPELDVLTSKVGVFEQLSSPDDILSDGDRVEIYRPLPVHPRQSRLNRARRTNQES